MCPRKHGSSSGAPLELLLCVSVVDSFQTETTEAQRHREMTGHGMYDVSQAARASLVVEDIS